MAGFGRSFPENSVFLEFQRHVKKQARLSVLIPREDSKTDQRPYFAKKKSFKRVFRLKVSVRIKIIKQGRHECVELLVLPTLVALFCHNESTRRSRPSSIAARISKVSGKTKPFPLVPRG
jgi:hypothetical protein